MAKVKKIVIDDFLTAGHISEATKSNPLTAVIRDIELIEAKALPFTSDKDKHQLTLELDDEEVKWFANKTSLKALRSSFGTSEASEWIGREIKLWVVEENVQGKLKQVIYADAS